MTSFNQRSENKKYLTRVLLEALCEPSNLSYLPSDGGSVVLILESAAAASSRANETDEVSLFKTYEKQSQLNFFQILGDFKIKIQAGE